MKNAIKIFCPIAETIQRLLSPYAEVVIHDLAKNQIIAIYNPFSKRKIGDPSLLSLDEINMDKDYLGPYEKINWDGRKLKSISSVIRDSNNKAVAMMCINLDISKLEKINSFIHSFINPESLIAQPDLLFKDDWQEKINKYIHVYLNNYHLSLESLERLEKKKLIEHLHHIGAFSANNAAVYIGKVLGVSKATIYNYLTDKKKSSE